MPYSKETNTFPSAEEVRMYLAKYARPCRRHIAFGANVLRVEPVDKDEEKEATTDEKRWRVTWTVADRPEACRDKLDVRTFTQIFDCVIVATGIFSKPHIPSLPGIHHFAGDVYHASEYNDARSANVEGKRVLVVGASFSGAEIAGEISTVAAAVTVSARRRFYYLNRSVKGIPVDLLFYSRAGRDAKKDVAPAVESDVESKVRFRKKHIYLRSIVDASCYSNDDTSSSPSSLRFPAVCGTPPFVAIADNFLSAVKAKRLAIRYSGVAGFVKGTKRVKFCDGRREDVFDTVIMATGYRPALSFLSPAILKTLEFEPSDWLQPLVLADCVWHPELSNLAFVGMYRGPYFAAIELQARWICGVFSGRLERPNVQEMQRARRRSRAIRHERPRRQFPCADYCGMIEYLAHRVGVRPKKILNDTEHPLYDHLKFGPVLPFHYRLVGFGAAPSIARGAIEECAKYHPGSSRKPNTGPRT
eukprot:g597.t1